MLDYEKGLLDLYVDLYFMKLRPCTLLIKQLSNDVLDFCKDQLQYNISFDTFMGRLISRMLKGDSDSRTIIHGLIDYLSSKAFLFQ